MNSQQIKKRLNNNRGITIVHALVSVLIFAVFSAIILSATSSNIKSAKAQKNYQQAYLSVSNAAQMFVDSIEGDYFTRTITTTTYKNKPTSTETGKWVYNEGKDASGLSNTLTNPLVNTKDGSDANFLTLFQLAYMGNQEKYTCNYIISTNVSGKGVDSFNVNVVCELIMVKGGDLYANFYLENPIGGNINDNYYMSLEIPVYDTKTPYHTDETDGTNKDDFESKKIETYRVEYDIENMEIHKGRYTNG